MGFKSASFYGGNTKDKQSTSLHNSTDHDASTRVVRKKHAPARYCDWTFNENLHNYLDLQLC